MPKPYLQRRGDAFAFRIAVPADLRVILKARELVRTLSTTDRRTAAPRALLLASKALTLFSRLRAMTDDERGGPGLDYTVEITLDDGSTFKAQGEAHEEAAINSALKTVMEAAARPGKVLYTPDPTPLPPAPVAPASPMLSVVIASYIRDYPPTKAGMLIKHKTSLSVFLNIVGDKPVLQLRQADIKAFFSVLNKLPPGFKHQSESKGLSYRRLAEMKHPKTIEISTFKSYRASVNLFLLDSIDALQDQGFPDKLNTERCEYTGKGKAIPEAQRAFKPPELKRLFEGAELAQFAATPDDVHKYWLPVLGLYTGARANELCQINPQVDVIQDAVTGIWRISLTEDTEAGDGIEKTMKGHKNRIVPMHRHLIELGFPEYVAALRGKGAKQLFPAWTARSERAAPRAITWFSKFLKSIDLHGIENENGRAVKGMHAFRHTLITYGKNKPAEVNLRCIVGHAERSDNTAADGYEDETILYDLTEKRDRLDRLDYGLNIPRPVLPAT